jgi:hypothetical protein
MNPAELTFTFTNAYIQCLPFIGCVDKEMQSVNVDDESSLK